jgi:1,4-dihydroxy-6-naphthoate synthase
MNKREFTLAHSPDADDAFMFYGLAQDKIDTGDITFKHYLQDIETLNHRAALGELDITAISVHAYAHVKHNYAILTAGGSLGIGYGPIIVANENYTLQDLKNITIAIPGKFTSAYLALRLCLGDVKTDIVPFNQIINAVTSGRAQAGVIIHEGQLYYADKGLKKILDLGEWWKKDTKGLPLPLGANAIKKSLGTNTIQKIAPFMRQTIEYSLANRQGALEYAKNYARDLPDAYIDKFVGMYVNELTLHLGDEGKKSYQLFLDRAHDAGLIPSKVELEFVDCG